MKMTELKPCPFCGHHGSRLMSRTEYRGNAEGLTAEVYEPDVGLGCGGYYHDVPMLDFRHVFYCRCNRCSARSRPVRTDWHVRTQEEADEFSPYSNDKLWGFEPESEWAEPWRDMAMEAWNRRDGESYAD